MVFDPHINHYLKVQLEIFSQIYRVVSVTDVTDRKADSRRWDNDWYKGRSPPENRQLRRSYDYLVTSIDLYKPGTNCCRMLGLLHIFWLFNLGLFKVTVNRHLVHKSTVTSLARLWPSVIFFYFTQKSTEIGYIFNTIQNE